MNHIVQIHQEFVKSARKWEELTGKEQREYLKRHPKSKRHITKRLEQKKIDKEINDAVREVQKMQNKYKSTGACDTETDSIIDDIIVKAIKDKKVKVPKTHKKLELIEARYMLDDDASKKQKQEYKNKLDDAAKDISEAIQKAISKIKKLRQRGYNNEIKRYL